jgi:XTP/dITP diphosphohydrolase
MMINKMITVPKLYLATTNPGKLREFQEAAQNTGLRLEMLPDLQKIPPPVEDGETFAANARIKAEFYSLKAPGALVLAEDSGLTVPELNGAPGVYSARYAAMLRGDNASGHSNSAGASHANSSDEDNNRALVSQLERLPAGTHAGKYVCVIALARDGKTMQLFTGEAHGQMLTEPRGSGGFGYDPYFYFPALGKTFAELALQEKRARSHRGQAIRALQAALPKIIEGL